MVVSDTLWKVKNFAAVININERYKELSHMKELSNVNYSEVILTAQVHLSVFLSFFQAMYSACHMMILKIVRNGLDISMDII